MISLAAAWPPKALYTHALQEVVGFPSSETINICKMISTKRMLLVSIPASTLQLIRYARVPYWSSAALLNFGYAVVIHLLIVYFYWGILYPKYISPLRHLPQPPVSPLPVQVLTILTIARPGRVGHLKEFYKEPQGASWRGWVDEVPHSGIFKFMDTFNGERVVVVSPAALADVLVH